MPRSSRVSRDRVILDLLATIGQWEPFVGPTGVRLYRVPTSAGIGTYTVGPTSCTCPADQYRIQARPCKHRQTLELALTVYREMCSHEETPCPRAPRIPAASSTAGRPREAGQNSH